MENFTGKIRILAFLPVLALLLYTAACGRPQDAGAYSGVVVTYGGEPKFLELAEENGENYGFVITETTELVWEDRSAFSVWPEDADAWDVFSSGMEVRIVPGESAESADEYVDACVVSWYTAEEIVVTGVQDSYFLADAKPVLYLYPAQETSVTVRLEYDGMLTCTYPAYVDGWQVTARPDGTLTDRRGQRYSYLYWEGVSRAEYDFSKGFCISGEETAAFLEEALEQLGLNRREANEFIVYWLPMMQENAYNVIAFQTEAYTEHAQMEITPAPDTLLRVFMAWYPAAEPVAMEPQSLSAPERAGFTAVEWGGAALQSRD